MSGAEWISLRAFRVREGVSHGGQLATLVRAPRDRVYDAFATAKGLDGWFTSGATMEPRAGAAFVWRWKEWGPGRVTTEAHGDVLEARRPERLVLRWDPGDGSRTRVEFDFVEDPRGTVVRMRETGFRDTPRGRKILVTTAGGWGEEPSPSRSSTWSMGSATDADRARPRPTRPPPLCPIGHTTRRRETRMFCPVEHTASFPRDRPHESWRRPREPSFTTWSTP